MSQKTEKHLPSSIRDFIYLDIEKLSSLYAQINKGLTDKIVTEQRDRIMTGEKSSGYLPFVQGAESHAARESHRGETSVLHDYMFNQLEEQLATALFDCGSASEAALEQAATDGNLVRVTGRPFVEDFEYLLRMTNKQRELQASLHLVTSFGKVAADVKKLRQQLRTADPKAKAKVTGQLDGLADQLLDMGPGSLEPLFLEHLEQVVRHFKGGSYEVTTCQAGDEGVRFRAVLDTRWLRYTPQQIREFYGRSSRAQWTIVGLATAFHASAKSTAAGNDGQAPEADVRDMADAFTNMFRILQGLEHTFRASASKQTLVITPFAIYRDFSLGTSG